MSVNNNSQTYKQLRQVARENSVPGRSKMNKEALANALGNTNNNSRYRSAFDIMIDKANYNNNNANANTMRTLATLGATTMTMKNKIQNTPKLQERFAKLKEADRLTILPTGSAVGDYAVSANGRYVVTTNAGAHPAVSPNIRVWDLKKPQSPMWQLDTKYNNLVTISSDGSMIAGLSKYGYDVKIWKLQRGEFELVQTMELGSVADITFMPNDNIAVVCAIKNSYVIEVYNINTLDKMFEIKGRGLWFLSFSPDGTMASAFIEMKSSKKVKVWNLVTQKLVMTIPINVKADSYSIVAYRSAFSWDNKIFAFRLGEGTTIKKINLVTGDSMMLDTDPYKPGMLGVSGDLIVTSIHYQPDVIVWDVASDTHQIVSLPMNNLWKKFIFIPPAGSKFVCTYIQKGPDASIGIFRAST